MSDLVERDAVLDEIEKWIVIELQYTNATPILIKRINELPSVTSESVTGFADRCRECGARYGRMLKKKSYALEQIRNEVEKAVVTNELRTPMEIKTEILQIIDKYKAESED